MLETSSGTPLTIKTTISYFANNYAQKVNSYFVFKIHIW